ncbi:tetratricopeptide repeat protein [Taibaiella sp. KBW10]|uniref:tetratricopeptide repeat protein n=1 Tax=Taibaiella sp. KBW10 TaxID=2153357 RepID=UPI0013150624|nr:tetratricopeptide repeat protein [Taibaiella sp. KBW10]
MPLRQASRFLILICILWLSACKRKQEQAMDSPAPGTFVLDTTDVEKTYARIEAFNAKTIDSLYEALAQSMSAENKYGLLLQHISYYDSMNPGSLPAKGLLAKTRGYYYNYLSKYDTATLFFEAAAAIYQKINSPADLADVYSGLATNFIYRAAYKDAVIYHYKALALYEAAKDSASIYRIKSDLSIDYHYQKNYVKAIETALECRTYYKRNENRAMIAYNESILSTLYYNIKAYPQAIEFAQSSLQLRREIGDQHDIAESLNNLSLPYMASEKWQEAQAVLTEALSLMEASGDIRQLPIIKQNLATCLWMTGHTEAAVRMLEGVITEARNKGQMGALSNACRKLYSIYKKEQQFAKALDYYQQYKASSDSLYNQDKTKIIDELNIKYETNQKQQRIQQLNYEQKINTTWKIIYLLLFIVAAGIGALIILLQHSRNRKNKLEIEQIRRELEGNEKDLLHFTESIISKNKFIDELETKLVQLSTAQTLQVQDSETLSELYQFKILTEDDWRQFKIHFDKVHPGFINKLRAQFPDMAPAEERQCLLIKLNIDNKECADMLGISILGVKKNRYRLKKRFGLQEQDKLDDFVKNIL